MIRNYFKIAYRNLLRYKWNSVFNIFGLSIGIACFIYIIYLIRFEVQYDAFHQDIERIYRLNMTLKVEGRTTHYACTPSHYGRYIKDNFEEVEKFARVKPATITTFSYQDKKFIEENFRYAEQDIFDIFTFEFLHGNKANALTAPFTAVIAEKMASKYFGLENPVGKMLKIDTAYYEITGVYKNLPKNSRLKYDALLSFVTGNPDQYTDWRAGQFLQTFIKLNEGVSLEQLAYRLQTVPETVNGERLKEQKEENILMLQALKDVHTDTKYELTWDTEPVTNPVYIQILLATGIFILIIASLNFINLSTAKYLGRAKEVKIRKTVGANRNQLVKQFLGESILIVFIAHIIGMFFIELTINKFNAITQLDININYMGYLIWFLLMGLIFFIGIISGAYPAFLLSSFRPTGMYNKGALKPHGSRLRKLLVIIQYTITIILLIGTTYIIKQVNFMINSPLGFSKENKLIIEFPRDLITPTSYQAVKEEFRTVPGVQATCFSSSIAGKWRYKWRIWETGKEEQSKHIYCMQIDNDFFDVYDINIIKGDKYFKENTRDTDWILNEAGIDIYGWSLDSALYQSLQGWHNIKAVVSNYHFEGLQRQIEPLAFFKIGEDFRYLTLKFSDGFSGNELGQVKMKFQELYPDLVFNYFFLSEEFESQYQSEKRIVKLFAIFTAIGLLIAIIGLFGLAVFICQQKEKEISIRKVNGASALVIFKMLSLDFTKWIVASFIVAVPIAYWGINSWINNFAYKTEISWAVFIVCGLSAWIVAMLTVSYQTYKSANTNPAYSLRFE